jgi:hypothetical protein
MRANQDRGHEKFSDLFVRYMEQTYANKPWVPSDPGPNYVSDEPPFDSLQFTVLEVLNVEPSRC